VGVVDGGFGAGDADIDVLMVRCVESILPCDSRTGIGSIHTSTITSTTMRDISDGDISDKDIDTKVWLRRRDEIPGAVAGAGWIAVLLLLLLLELGLVELVLLQSVINISSLPLPLSSPLFPSLPLLRPL
jgi:hypothetical protein